VIVDDTPADLGPALPLLYGSPACAGLTSYVFNRYDQAWLDPVFDTSGKVVIGWRPRQGAEEHQYQESILIDERVRHNVMSYWLCDPSSQRFSVDQVRRMHFVLTERRQNLIGRTIKLYEDFAPIRQSILVQAAEARSRLLHVDNEFQRGTKGAVPAALHQCGVRDKKPMGWRVA
jgi:hypothetical protein